MNYASLRHLSSALSLSLFVALAGCGSSTSDAHFADEGALVELGATHDLRIDDVDDIGALRIETSGDAIEATLTIIPGALFGQRLVARVVASSVGTGTIQLFERGTLLDTIEVESAPVANVRVEALVHLQGEFQRAPFALLVDSAVLIRLVGEDARGRAFDHMGIRIVESDEHVVLSDDWFGIRTLEVESAGTHTLVIVGLDQVEHEVTVDAVDAADVTALRFDVASDEEGTTVAVVGVTDDERVVLGLSALVTGGGVALETSGFGGAMLDTTPVRGTVLTASWNGLSATYTF